MSGQSGRISSGRSPVEVLGAWFWSDFSFSPLTRPTWRRHCPVLPLLCAETEGVAKMALEYKGTHENGVGEEMVYWCAHARPLRLVLSCCLRCDTVTLH